MSHTLKIRSISQVTHNVRRIRLDKPEGFHFIPGQASDVAINEDRWKNETRPFTFTCLNQDPFLEFTIKSYNDHDGVTKRIGELEEGAELILSDPWGVIEYRGEGYFIAGGAGITPFMAILRQLHKDGLIQGNKLFFSNRTPQDIIYHEELQSMLGENAMFVITEQKDGAGVRNYINEKFLKANVPSFDKPFYICGPDAMVKDLSDLVVKNGADANSIIFER